MFPTPMFPELMMERMVDDAEDTASKSLVGVDVAQREREAYGVAVAIPRRPNVLSQLNALEERMEEPSVNCTWPEAPDGDPPSAPHCMFPSESVSMTDVPLQFKVFARVTASERRVPPETRRPTAWMPPLKVEVAAVALTLITPVMTVEVPVPVMSNLSSLIPEDQAGIDPLVVRMVEEAPIDSSVIEPALAP